MAKLTDDVKAFIVRALACYDTPEQVARAVKQEFGLDVSRQACEAYDPNKYVGRNLSQKWRVIFEKTREAFKTDVGDIPIANISFRLRTLQRTLAEAEKRGNTVVVLQALEQAAKEAGGAFTNKTRVEASGPNGAPLQHGVVTTTVPPDEYKKVVRQALDDY
ncbi:hypothetical protein AQ938_06890 [Burkholderia pseudomallei]|uniref:DUF2280 domain-containing protein n=1 Tax=Burkholderia pseudomallei TaxID=28450 RepID=UPI000055B59D|nr:DUF2280 domain-containing protein [Burkholderia pseudomallei]AJX59876.1 hypothetical protein DP47_3389 [Burkholderia pseudomallei Pasteur 52237]EDO95495.1 phage protein [Burkholderia pseudomallei Pasteur 52237]MWA16571.1 DUF2280 domain-containing protein [Burkholderia pseudomallei]OND78998.1 hypothetical protein AQ938_06890 [Burkholderia pseudomallei]VBQ81025.1 Uncharacterized conserved protein [Burkholderia pseudomallei]